MKHYNEIQDVSLTDDDFLRILNGIGKSDALVVKIVDILILMVAGYLAYIVSGNNKVLLVGNKADLIPKSVKHDKVKH